MAFANWIHRTAWLGLLLLGCTTAFAQEDDEWPRQMDTAGWTVVMYQPQVESFKDNKMESRAAVSLKGPEMKEAQFGALWFSCTVSADYDTRRVTLLDLKVTDSKFPGLTAPQVQNLAAYLEKEIPTWHLVMDLDRLIADLEGAGVSAPQADRLNNDPPIIYYRRTPTVLIFVDGEPILREIEGTKLKYVANSPYFLLRDEAAKIYYLRGGNFWYTSSKIDSGWKNVATVPDEVQKLAQKAQEAAKSSAPPPDSGVPEITTPPDVIVSTKPAELLLSEGEPQWASVEGTGLLYLKNSENDVLMDVETQQYYVLLAGRWYRSPSLDAGPWKHVPPDQVPKDFAKIPPDSDMGDVLPSVAGTDEARAAVLEATIPKTAEVDRTKTLTVEYDGDPKFDPIQGTDMKYAVNTAKSVLQIDGKYYCCDEAVWYVADKPKGPWQVATSVPSDVKDIPASSPAYNTKYVYVYDTTTTVVYVAYTPAYTGCYYYGGCMVYGTGYWYYPPYPAYYYPHPVTYGFGVHYNPWTGWGFTFGVSYGWLNIGFTTGGYYGGYWGCGGYNHGYRHGYGAGYYHGRRDGFAAGYWAGSRNGGAQAKRDPYSGQSGVRGSQPRASTQPAGGGGERGARPSTQPSTGKGTGARPSTQPATGAGAGAAARPSTQPATGAGAGQSGTRTPKSAGTANNVYTDKNGNVYRNEGGQWQERDNAKGSWNAAGGSGNHATNRATTSSGKPSASTQDLNRSQQSRQTGAQRSQSYSSSRSGGASRGGGGGRRR